MSTKEEILSKVRSHIGETYDMPDISRINAIRYEDKIAQFMKSSGEVGGAAELVANGANINERIRELYPDAKRIASNLKDITIQTFNPDEVADPRELNNTDLAIVQGEIGVAENGCVWIPLNVVHKALYFISEYLVIVIDRTKIVHNMHEAYAQLQGNQFGFGVFVSGPSKTADIEQALVVGAHGPRGVTVLIK